MIIKVGVQKGSKVSLSRATGDKEDRFEPSEFGVSLGEEYTFADAPEDPQAYGVWQVEKEKFYATKLGILNAQAEAELQGAIDQFLEDNKPGE